MNDLLFRLLLGLVVLAPLPLGANRPWAWTLLALLAGALLAAWSLAGLIRGPRRPPDLGLLWPSALPYLVVLGWGWVQASPLAPAGWQHPLWGEAAAALPVRVAGAVSLDPALTREAVMKLLGDGAVFWLAALLGWERRRARLAIAALAWAGIAYALYGLIVYEAGWESLLWLPKWAYLGDLTATFVSRNAYGAYAGLGLLCCLGLLLARLRPPDRGGVRHRVERLLIGALPYGLGALPLAVALLLSHSRGALIATGTGIAVLLAALLIARALSWRLFLAAGLCLGIGGAALAFTTGEATMERLLRQNELQGDRGQLLRLGGVMVEDAPWTGFGLGAFAPAFRLYRDVSLPRPVVYDYAHNIYIEAAVGLGLPAALLLGSSVALVLGQCALGLRRRRRDQLYPALALAAAALLLVHGIVDFSIEMPAIAVTLALLLGIGVAQSRSRAGSDWAESHSDPAQSANPSPFE